MTEQEEEAATIAAMTLEQRIEAAEKKIRDDINWRGILGKPKRYVVINRELMVAYMEGVEALNRAAQKITDELLALQAERKRDG